MSEEATAGGTQRAKRKLGNIKSAIEQGILTPTTKAMLEESERKVSECDAALRSQGQRKVVYLPGVVDACLRDLKGSLEEDPDYARDLLAKLLGDITLRREGKRLYADIRGNLPGLLDLGDEDLRQTWCRRRDSNPHGREPRRF
jgi:hypothetical protein